MKNILIIITIFVLYGTNVLCNENKSNSLSDSEIKNLLKGGKFEKGYIFQEEDTIVSDILVYRRLHRNFSFQYCIVRMPNDSIKILSPMDIDGYNVNNQKFIKHVSEGNNFFIELREEGRINLFSRGGIPNDNRFLFYLKFSTVNEYLVISPFEKDIDLQGSEKNYYNHMIIIKTNDIDLKFKKFVEVYFSECTEVVNMVNSNYYTINDIPNIVKTYNSCFD